MTHSCHSPLPALEFMLTICRLTMKRASYEPPPRQTSSDDYDARYPVKSAAYDSSGRSRRYQETNDTNYSSSRRSSIGAQHIRSQDSGMHDWTDEYSLSDIGARAVGDESRQSGSERQDRRSTVSTQLSSSFVSSRRQQLNSPQHDNDLVNPSQLALRPIYSRDEEDEDDPDGHIIPFNDEYQDTDVFGQNTTDTPFWKRFRNQRAFPSKRMTKIRKRRIILLLSFMFLGCMGGLVYWLYAQYGFWIFDDNENNNTNATDSNQTVAPTSPTVAPIADPNPTQDDGTSTPSNTTNTTTPGPPLRFEEVCSRENVIGSIWGMMECEAICRTMECCYFRNVSSDLSCFESRDMECRLYSPLCNVFYGVLPHETNNSSIAEAPTNLTSTCGNDTLETSGGVQECSDACYDGYCCFSSALSILANLSTTSPSCFETNPQQCAAYAPCLTPIVVDAFQRQNVTETSTPPFPETSLDGVCSETSLDTQAGFVECTAKCLLGQCCVDSQSETSCIMSHALTCAFYAPCQNLLVRMNGQSNASHTGDTNATASMDEVPLSGSENQTESKTATIDPPDTDINIRCSEVVLSTSTGPLLCDAVCQPGECCFANDTATNCYASNPQTCELYHPCLLYWETTQAPTTSAPSISIWPTASPSPSLNQTGDISPSENATFSPSASPNSHTGGNSPSENATLAPSVSPTSHTGGNSTREIATLIPSVAPTSFQAENITGGDGTSAPSPAEPSRSPTPTAALAEGLSEFPTLKPSGSILNSESPSTEPTSVELLKTTFPNATLAPTEAPVTSSDTNGTASTNQTETEIGRMCSVEATKSPEGQLECGKLCFEGTCCFQDTSLPESCVTQETFCAYYEPCLTLLDALGSSNGQVDPQDTREDSNSTITATNSSETDEQGGPG